MTKTEAEAKVRKLIALAKDPSTDPAHQANLIERAHAIGRKHGFDAAQVQPEPTRRVCTATRSTGRPTTGTPPKVSHQERERRTEMVIGLLNAKYLTIIEAAMIGSVLDFCSLAEFDRLLQPARDRLKAQHRAWEAERALKAARRKLIKHVLTFGGIALLWLAGTVTVIVHAAT